MVEPNEELQLVFDKAIKDAKKLHHEYVTLEHLLFSMLCSENFNNLLKGYGCLVEELKKQLETYLKTGLPEIVMPKGARYKPKKTQTVERVLNRAFTQVLFAGRAHITLSDVLLSILSEKKSHAAFYLDTSGVDKDKFADKINKKEKCQVLLRKHYVHLLLT